MAEMATDGVEPDVSFVVPARNEADRLQGALASISALDTAYEYEVIVVDGDSTDGTPAVAREHGAIVVDGSASSIARARNQGAKRARGEWLAFVDADTQVRSTYLTELLGYAEANGLAAASSYCRMTGPRRAKIVEATINYLVPRLERPILPGFNVLVRAEAVDEIGGFPDVPNEDTAFSRRLALEYPTGYCRRRLVENSGRRIDRLGLTGTLVYDSNN
ncbi:glycosyl transferase family 2 [Halobiforma lacisalsi AJ5]|uniref:Family 2 glycosyl transferase n=1 Tax=Natronobacterium lacisalsi AJ5 TaxID=358396 RepID=M0L1D9_NATLA|nr:glycosyltransferase [Halobiforma lacisalsi]APW96348.1 glycosyl transferase family 2 [Halobiforma lacisalsi AJ5]EMA27377.1 family 2 glycosyl transferase [Halobiforma lacisalsi AJ5]